MRILVVATLLLLLAACRQADSAASSTPPDCLLVPEGSGPAGTVPVRAEVVASGLEVPWGLAFLPGGDVLVTERPGRLRLIRDGRLVPDPVATIAVETQSEDGLLGIAADPDFAQNRRFFLYYTHRKPDGAAVNRIERWVLAPDGRSARADRVLRDDIPAAQFHSGGRLRIGPDGMLYAGTGDARKPDTSRDRASLAGKILRLTRDGAVPADNPIPGNPAYVLGLRNCQGFDWLGPGRLVVTDHGPSGELGCRGADEVNVAGPGDDLGWPTTWKCESKGGLVAPALTWVRAAPPGGAAIYTGDAIPAWKGSVLVGVLGARHLHRVVFAPGSSRVAQHEVYFAGDPPGGLGRVRDVAMGPDGHLWVTTSNCDGRGECGPDKDRVLRILPADR